MYFKKTGLIVYLIVQEHRQKVGQKYYYAALYDHNTSIHRKEIGTLPGLKGQLILKANFKVFI